MVDKIINDLLNESFNEIWLRCRRHTTDPRTAGDTARRHRRVLMNILVHTAVTSLDCDLEGTLRCVRDRWMREFRNNF